MNTLEVSLHATTMHPNGGSTMKTKGRWSGGTHLDAILETQPHAVWINGILGSPRFLQRDEAATDEGLRLTQPLLGDVFQIDGGAR